MPGSWARSVHATTSSGRTSPDGSRRPVAPTTKFQPGDDVFDDILSSMGGFAEYVCVPERALAPMPAGLTYEEAAALPQAGAIALQGIWDNG
jgi:NADPH:quinone reductase-like Zn-dependent oxidoreductase